MVPLVALAIVAAVMAASVLATARLSRGKPPGYKAYVTVMLGVGRVFVCAGLAAAAVVWLALPMAQTLLWTVGIYMATLVVEVFWLYRSMRSRER